MKSDFSYLALTSLPGLCLAGCGAPAPTDSDAGVDAGMLINPTPDSGTPAGLAGTLGTLGALQPIVSSWVISNSGETLIYLSTAPLTCATVQTSRWLGTQPAGSQVVEIVMRGAPASGQTVNVPPAEVNYAAGARSSSYEKGASSGHITFTTASASGPVEGTLQAAYSDGSALSGPFKADFCANGQGF